MKFVEQRPFADPETAARKLMEIAKAVEPVQDGRIHIEKINWPFYPSSRAARPNTAAGLKLAIERGWLWLHESGTMRSSRPLAPSCSPDLRDLASSSIHGNCIRVRDRPCRHIRTTTGCAILHSRVNQLA